MAVTEPHNIMEKYAKAALKPIPFASRFVNVEPYQLIRIPLLEYFNNQEFLARELVLELKNPSLLFQNVYINVRSSLFGLRYIMREYFYSCAFLFVFWMASFVFIVLTLALYFVNQNV